MTYTAQSCEGRADLWAQKGTGMHVMTVIWERVPGQGTEGRKDLEQPQQVK